MVGGIGLVLCVLLSAFANAADVLKIMPLGDSNTRGTMVAGIGPNPASIGAGGYRYPLQQMLTKGGYQFDFVGSQTTNCVGEQGTNPPTSWVYDPTFDRDHQGLPGFGNEGLITGGPAGSVPNLPGEEDSAPSLVTCLSTYHPDIVLLMSGTNGIDPADVGANLRSLDKVIRTITTNAPKTRAIVSTIFDRWSKIGLGKDATYGTATETYNAGIPGLVEAAQLRGGLVSFVDVGGALTRDDFCYSGAMADGIHPNPVVSNPKEAAVWYAGIEKVTAIPEPNSLVLTLVFLAATLFGMVAYAGCKRKQTVSRVAVDACKEPSNG